MFVISCVCVCACVHVFVVRACVVCVCFWCGVCVCVVCVCFWCVWCVVCAREWKRCLGSHPESDGWHKTAAPCLLSGCPCSLHPPLWCRLWISVCLSFHDCRLCTTMLVGLPERVVPGACGRASLVPEPHQDVAGSADGHAGGQGTGHGGTEIGSGVPR